MFTCNEYDTEGANVSFKDMFKKNSEELEKTAGVPDAAEIDAEREARRAEKEAEKKAKRRKHKRVMRVLDRICGFIIATGIIVGCACLALEYIIVKGPSTSLRDAFVSTMEETRRFKFIPNIFLTEAEVKEIYSRNTGEQDITTDVSLINLPTEEVQQVNEDGEDAYGLVDEDGDGIIYVDIKRGGFQGYMIIVLDPTRVFVGMPNDYGGVGLTLEEMCQKYDALGGINAGGFKDDGGSGLGGLPQGLTIVDGYCYNDETWATEGTVGFDKDGLMHVGFYSYEQCVELGIVNAVSFGPILISNGVPTESIYGSSLNPRTAIAQRADGAVIMLVIDGRQVHSIGATYQDVVDVLLDYGAVNACNMDGGSSTTMYYNGEYVNSCSSANGVARPLPNAFLFK